MSETGSCQGDWFLVLVEVGEVFEAAEDSRCSVAHSGSNESRLIQGGDSFPDDFFDAGDGVEFGVAGEGEGDGLDRAFLRDGIGGGDGVHGFLDWVSLASCRLSDSVMYLASRSLAQKQITR